MSVAPAARWTTDMPEPTKGESLSGFVSKYMKSKESRKKFPKRSQRSVAAYSEAREHYLKK